MTFRSLVIKIILFLVPISAAAAETHDRIYEHVEAFLITTLEQLQQTANFSRFDMTIGKLDPRLKLAHCEQPLEFNLISDPLKSSRNTVKVSCQGTWNIIVTSKIELFHNVIVANQTINRNTALSPDLFETMEKPLNKLRYGYYSDFTDLENRVAKRHISLGDIITPHMVEGAELIQRGDNVVIIATSDILKVKMTGTAMTDGKFGQQITIKNHSSNRVIKGIVTDRGKVNVPL